MMALAVKMASSGSFAVVQPHHSTTDHLLDTGGQVGTAGFGGCVGHEHDRAGAVEQRGDGPEGAVREGA